MFVDLIFEVRDSEEGRYGARALGHTIFTPAEIWKELRTNAVDDARVVAVRASCADWKSARGIESA